MGCKLLYNCRIMMPVQYILTKAVQVVSHGLISSPLALHRLLFQLVFTRPSKKTRQCKSILFGETTNAACTLRMYRLYYSCLFRSFASLFASPFTSVVRMCWKYVRDNIVVEVWWIFRLSMLLSIILWNSNCFKTKQKNNLQQLLRQVLNHTVCIHQNLLVHR